MQYTADEGKHHFQGLCRLCQSQLADVIAHSVLAFKVKRGAQNAQADCHTQRLKQLAAGRRQPARILQPLWHKRSAHKTRQKTGLPTISMNAIAQRFFHYDLMYAGIILFEKTCSLDRDIASCTQKEGLGAQQKSRVSQTIAG